MVHFRIAMLLCLVSSCAYSSSLVRTPRPSSERSVERALQIAEQTARRFRMTPLEAFDGELPGGARMLAKFMQKMYSRDEYYPLDGSVAQIRFGVYAELDGSLRFSFLDYSHGRETEYVRLMRDDLETRLRAAFPGIELRHEQHSGRTLPP